MSTRPKHVPCDSGPPPDPKTPVPIGTDAHALYLNVSCCHPFGILHHLNAVLPLKVAQVEDVELQSMTDAATEPLIPSNREQSNNARYHEDDAEDVEVDEGALVSPGLFIWGLTICAGVSGLLFGYEYVLVKCNTTPHLCFHPSCVAPC